MSASSSTAAFPSGGAKKAGILVPPGAPKKATKTPGVARKLSFGPDSSNTTTTAKKTAAAAAAAILRANEAEESSSDDSSISSSDNDDDAHSTSSTGSVEAPASPSPPTIPARLVPPPPPTKKALANNKKNKKEKSVVPPTEESTAAATTKRPRVDSKQLVFDDEHLVVTSSSAKTGDLQTRTPPAKFVKDVKNFLEHTASAASTEENVEGDSQQQQQNGEYRLKSQSRIRNLKALVDGTADISTLKQQGSNAINRARMTAQTAQLSHNDAFTVVTNRASDRVQVVSTMDVYKKMLIKSARDLVDKVDKDAIFKEKTNALGQVSVLDCSLMTLLTHGTRVALAEEQAKFNQQLQAAAAAAAMDVDVDEDDADASDENDKAEPPAPTTTTTTTKKSGKQNEKKRKRDQEEGDDDKKKNKKPPKQAPAPKKHKTAANNNNKPKSK